MEAASIYLEAENNSATHPSITSRFDSLEGRTADCCRRSSRPRSYVVVSRCRNTSSSTSSSAGPQISMTSVCTLKSWILFLCFLLSTMQLHTTAAMKVDLPPRDANHGIARAARRSGLRRLLRLRELQANNNVSNGLRQDESILLSWTNGSAYLSANWVENDASGPCGWPGVSCGKWLGENRVTVVNLASLNLSGSVPARIAGLPALTSLSLASNNLYGSIPPEIGTCINLRELNLTNNKLTGYIPIELGGLPQLQSLDLSRNSLNGTIPPLLFANCKNLVSFNVSSNKLNGRLPEKLGHCSRLRTVDVGNNSLSGEIPLLFGRELPYLEDLIMADNRGFKGSIPDTLLSNCLSLRKIDIAWNQFSGPLPSKLGNCSNLEMLIAQGNQFSGSLPGDFGNLKKLKVLGLGNNNLTGDLPQDISNCSSLELLDVGNNALKGRIPPWLGQLSNLQFVTFQINEFFGTIPVEVTTLSTLRYLDLSNNFITGSVLPEFGNVTSLRLLRLSSNQLTGRIPAELGYVYNLQGLDLSSNNLTGSIPKSFGNLQDLLWLQLGDNNLTGTIPGELGNCSSLMWINLAKNRFKGHIPQGFSDMGRDSERVFQQNRENPWILDGVGECALLSTWSPEQSQHFETLLDLSEPQKCHSWLPHLVRGDVKLPSNRSTSDRKVLGYWQIGRNELTGPFPNLTRATTLAFLIASENNLTGPIPEELGNLPLYNLNLSRNNFNGTIPGTLGKATLLVTLDMSYNGLSGPIPTELENLYALRLLNFSYNELLRGPIPSKGQFTTLGWEPYIGDIDLCFNDTVPIYQNILRDVNMTAIAMPKLCSEVPSAGSTGKKRRSNKQKIVKALLITFLSSLSTLAALLLLCTAYCMLSKWRKRVATAKAKELGFWDVDMSGNSYWSEKRILQIAIASFGTPCLQSLTYAHLLHATNNFSPKNIVGDGGFGIVYKATLANGMTVAIKKLVQNGAQGPREFHAEMETLGMIQHENLVSLLGYCCNHNDEMLLVYEYLTNGSLDDWLYESDERAAKLSWPLRLRIAVETARGLAFLHHDCKHHIIHRDMKSSNILLNEHFKAVLTDFGMARIMDSDSTHVSTVVAGTPGYVPPEYSHTWRATTKGDVYSFGIVMLELLSGNRPTGPLYTGRCGANLIEMTRILVSSDRPLDICAPTVLESGATQQLSEFLALALRCTVALPTSRPSMRDVVQTLESIRGLDAPQFGKTTDSM